MRLSKTICTLVVLAAASSWSVEPAHSQSVNISAQPEYQAVAEGLSRFIEHEIEQKKIPAFSIALVDGTDIVWAHGFGLADPQQKTPATAQTIYRVGSVSKLLSDVAVVQLIEQGKLDLDADIQRVLPRFKPANPYDRPITLRQLMNHTSGLVREPPKGNYFDPTEPTLEEMVYSLNDTKLVHSPDTKTKYSNAAVSVAGFAIEQVTGNPYSEHLKTSLLDPLGMKSSSYLPNNQISASLARAEMWSYDGRRFPAPTFTLGTIPAGNLFSSVTDLSRFMIAIFNGGRVGDRQVISAELLTEMLKPQTAVDGQQRKYGIGFRLGDFYGHRTFEHGGAVYGYATQFRGLPDQRIGVIAVASLDVANGFVSRVADDALRMILDVKHGDPIQFPMSTKPVSRSVARGAAGLYENSKGEKRRLFETGGRLMMQGDTYDQEIRKIEDQYIIDDVMTYGPLVQLANQKLTINGETWHKVNDTMPANAPQRWAGLIGEYGWDHNTMFIYEKHGRLWTLIEWVFHYPLTEESEDVFAFPNYGLYHDEKLYFQRDEAGNATQVVAAEVTFKRRNAGPAQGETFTIRPLMPAERLRKIALAAEPPVESRDFLKPDLVEPTSLDPTIKLDIRYATTNNFMGSVFYKQPRAFLQRPAAEALVQAHQTLKEHGYGLLIHDAYRPWFVTKMFWDATPQNMKHFVANPAWGSRHNRGCAVDLTLYDRKTGEVVPMVAGYDEFSERAYPDYPGGTSRQRWHRRLLRTVMEEAGFEIYEYEWWHFDYHQWRNYPILNKTFEELDQR